MLIFSESPVVLVIGTRPDAIKMIPVYQALKRKNIPTILLSTGQHAELLDSILDMFGITPDYDLKIMKHGQSLSHITTTVLEKVSELFKQVKPALVLVQGDTTSAASAALAAFYLEIPIAHVEAGLRTGDLYNPFPEEMNRRLISLLASYHFTATQTATEHLLEEKIKKESIFCTGNTVIDALVNIQEKIKAGDLLPPAELVKTLEEHHRLGHQTLLFTMHRRESLDNGLEGVFSTMKQALEQYPHLHIIYPEHPNPGIQKTRKKAGLDALPNLSIIPPLPYHEMIYLLSNIDGVATDSGGLQEEAIYLNKPLLILRNTTDRTEGLLGNAQRLVGTNQEAILEGLKEFTSGHLSQTHPNPLVYGNGLASNQIAQIVREILERLD